MEVQIDPDTRRWWVAYPFWLARALVVGVVLGIAMVASGDFSIPGAMLAVLTITVVVGIPVGSVWAAGWALGPGRTVYAVRRGELLVCRGRRVVRRFPCSEIVGLRLRGALTWRELLARNWIRATPGLDGWPTLEVELPSWPANRLQFGPQAQRGILLWGAERAAGAQEALRTAVTDNGASLRT